MEARVEHLHILNFLDQLLASVFLHIFVLFAFHAHLGKLEKDNLHEVVGHVLEASLAERNADLMEPGHYRRALRHIGRTEESHFPDLLSVVLPKLAGVVDLLEEVPHALGIIVVLPPFPGLLEILGDEITVATFIGRRALGRARSHGDLTLLERLPLALCLRHLREPNIKLLNYVLYVQHASCSTSAYLMNL